MPITLLSDDTTIEVRDSDIIVDGDKDTVYTLRKLTPKANRAIVKAKTTPGNNRNRGDRIDWDSVLDDQIDYVLVGWTGVHDPRTNQPAECSRENKVNGLDAVRKTAILDRAGLADVQAAEDAKQDSFRPPA